MEKIAKNRDRLTMGYLKSALWMLPFTALIGIACTKKDGSAPIITLLGYRVDTVGLHEPYTDKGVTAFDTQDGDLTAAIAVSAMPDVDHAGIYTVTYSASDKAGNRGQVARTVLVQHTYKSTGGNYVVSDSCNAATFTYNDLLSIDTTGKWFRAVRFANYENAPVYMTFSDRINSTITVPQQTLICGTVPDTVVFKGSGSISSDGKKLRIQYKAFVNKDSSVCTSVYSR